MNIRRKILIPCILGCVFISSFLLGVNVHFPAEKGEKKDDTPATNSLVTVSTGPAVIAPSSRDEGADMTMFMQKLQKVRSSKECEKLFNAKVLGRDAYSQTQEEVRKRLVIKKWAEVAPMQCLQQLQLLEGEETKFLNFKSYLYSVFSGWAGKDPEAALSFYSEHFKDDSGKKSNDVLKAIMAEYGRISPEKAWEWLDSREESLDINISTYGKFSILTAIAENHRELIPEYVAKMRPETLNSLAYKLGHAWGSHDATSKEWMEGLPENTKILAEAGRILGSSKGDLEQIEHQLLDLPMDDQIATLEILMPRIMENGPQDMVGCVDWLWERLPEDRISFSFKLRIENWMKEDSRNAKAWLDTLPPGNKKTELEQIYKRATPKKNPL